MKPCECCVKKSQYADKVQADMMLIREWIKDITVHSQKLGTSLNAPKKICIQVLADKAEDLINDNLNGKFRKFLGVCHTEEK